MIVARVFTSYTERVLGMLTACQGRASLQAYPLVLLTIRHSFTSSLRNAPFLVIYQGLSFDASPQAGSRLPAAQTAARVLTNVPELMRSQLA